MWAGGELAEGQERLAWAIGPYRQSTTPVGRGLAPAVIPALTQRADMESAPTKHPVTG